MCQRVDSLAAYDLGTLTTFQRSMTIARNDNRNDYPNYNAAADPGQLPHASSCTFFPAFAAQRT